MPHRSRSIECRETHQKELQKYAKALEASLKKLLRTSLASQGVKDTRRLPVNRSSSRQGRQQGRR